MTDPDPRRLDPERGFMEPPADGWEYQEGAGWYNPADLEQGESQDV